MALHQVKSTKTTTTEIYVAPCINCGCDNIYLGDCGYSSFNVAYGRCTRPVCKREVKFNCGDVTMEDIIQFWNRNNDVDLLIGQKVVELEKVQLELKELKVKRRKFPWNQPINHTK